MTFKTGSTRLKKICHSNVACQRLGYKALKSACSKIGFVIIPSTFSGGGFLEAVFSVFGDPMAVCKSFSFSSTRDNSGSSI
jgi:hypothetical protein